jgi:hypothetical protein
MKTLIRIKGEEGKAVLVDAMKANNVSENKDPVILNLSST